MDEWVVPVSGALSTLSPCRQKTLDKGDVDTSSDSRPRWSSVTVPTARGLGVTGLSIRDWGRDLSTPGSLPVS